MSFPRYPAYKESGVAWLGEVPVHWDVRRLKHVARATPSNVDKKAIEGEQPVLLCNYTDVYYNDRIVMGMDFMPATASDDQVRRFTLRGGDVIITKDSETADDIAIATFVPEDLPGVVCGYHLTLIRAEPGTHGSYLKWLFGSGYLRARFHVAANGLTRVGLSQYAVDNVDLPLPPEGEQLAIAAFLDRETARIDALVTEQERLIELLREKRQAVISHAVTKGLDPSVPMKDSGVNWLGTIPAHWKVDRWKWGIRSAKNGVWGDDPQGDDTDLPCVRVADFDRRLLRARMIEPTIRSVKLGDREGRVLRRGDLLLEKSGGGELQPVGFVVLYDHDQPAVCSNFVARLVPAETTHSAFLVYQHAAAYSVRLNQRSIKQTSGIQNLDQQAYLDERTAYPPLREQQAIAAFLDQKTERIDALITESKRTITLLQERRAALISATVTGQIDVREAP